MSQVVVLHVGYVMLFESLLRYLGVFQGAYHFREFYASPDLIRSWGFLLRSGALRAIASPAYPQLVPRVRPVLRGRGTAPFPDVNSDRFISPIDALRVITYLNSGVAEEGEGEITLTALAREVLVLVFRIAIDHNGPLSGRSYQ